MSEELFVIEKNCKEIIALAILIDGLGPSTGCYAIKHTTDNGCYYTIINNKKFADILDRVDEGGYDIFNYSPIIIEI